MNARADATERHTWQDLDELRQSVSLVDLVSATLGAPATRSGDWYKWLCPFHSDSATPSLTVKDNRFYCFGCQAHGDAIDWLQRTENLSFAEAVERLGSGAMPKRIERPAPSTPEPDGAALLAQFQATERWEQYHANLDDWSRAEWQRRYGVKPAFLSAHLLGYCPSYGSYGPTITIPFLYGDDWQCRVVKHRLLNSDEVGGKYRYEPRKQPQCLYLTQPDAALAGRFVVAIEGEIKAIVVNQAIQDRRIVVVGMPGATPSNGVVEQLREANEVLLVMDPGAEEQGERLAQQVGGRTRLLVTTEKIDDAIIAHDLTGTQVRRWLRQARRSAP